MCLMTGTDSPGAGSLIWLALYMALRYVCPEEGFEESLKELLLDEPPGDPLEAIVRSQILFCHFKASAYAEMDKHRPWATNSMTLSVQKLSGELQEALDQWRERQTAQESR
jgi:hypothetical protein